MLRDVKKVLFIFSVLIFFCKWAGAAPAPWGFAINVQKKKCANFWPGDEFSHHGLPEGWKFYWMPASRKSILKTDLGTCQFDARDFFVREVNDSWKECFKTLGCDYVSFESFDAAIRGKINQSNGCIAIPDGGWWGPMLVIDKNKKQCTLVTCSNPPTEQSSNLSQDFQLCPEPVSYDTFETEAGNCTIKQSRDNNFSECCSQLGYEFIRNIRK